MDSSTNRRPLLDETEDSDVDDFIDNGYQDNSTPKTNGDPPELERGTFTQNAPNDKYNYSYLIFYLLGMTTLLPWNFFITAEDYWMYKFRNVTTNDTHAPLTPLQTGFTSDLSVTASVAGTAFLILNALYSHKYPLKLRMLGTMFSILILFVINTSLVEVNTDSWQQNFFIVTLTVVVMINSFAAILSGSLFGIAGLFPSEYMTAVVSGQALGGIFASLTMVVALTFGASPKTTAFVYFSIGNAILILSIITYAIMSKTRFFRYYAYDCDKKSDVTTSQESLDGERRIVIEPEFRAVIRKIYLYAVAECSVFAITLSVYPAVTVLVQSQYHGNGHPWNDIYFMPVVNYLAFNSGDYLGRILAGLFVWPKSQPHLIILMTLIRALFIPILMMTNTVIHNFLPLLVQSDVVFIFLMLTFSISNGYLANIALIMAPRVVMHHEKEMAASIMAACLSIGLMFGSALSLVMVRLL